MWEHYGVTRCYEPRGPGDSQAGDGDAQPCDSDDSFLPDSGDDSFFADSDDGPLPDGARMEADGPDVDEETRGDTMDVETHVTGAAQNGRAPTEKHVASAAQSGWGTH